MNVSLIIAPFINPLDAKIRINGILKWLGQLSDKIFLVTANFPYSMNDCGYNNIEVINVKYMPKTKASIFMKIVNHCILQIKVTLNLLKSSRSSHLLIFWLCGDFILPMLAGRISKRKIILFVTGSWSECAKVDFANSLFGKGGFIFYFIERIIEKATYRIADRIILLSPNLQNQIKTIAGERYLSKCEVLPARPIDTKVFKIIKPLATRQNVVGYVGRLDRGKGVDNLIKAFKIKEILQNTKLIIIGDGPLFQELVELVKNNALMEQVTFKGWLLPEEVAMSLNEIKLLVLPSYSEGLPVSILEAMACGTPVLATSVGGISDIIVDGKTGFILNDNSPEEIAIGIMRALKSPLLDQVIFNARKIIEKEYTYEILIDKYKSVLLN